ncbi:MAG: bifunctional UDP-sugar hydrolase/5'-nucleotidase [Actinomycetaceae bacterium]|nr:bifunctional UDP-sugar hydrolase/5'-nucleotidase [Actinomycetaceae bacterium]
MQFKRIVLSSTAAVLGLILAGGTSLAMAEPVDDVVELHLYNLTDIHGHIEQVEYKGKIVEAGLESIGCYLEKAQRSHADSALTLLGDNIGASPFTSGILYDNPTIAALNELKPQASTIGNHELDLGQDTFRARLEGSTYNLNGNDVAFEKIGFPYLGANVNGLGDFKNGSGPYLKPYHIWQSPAGIKVAYIGAIAPDVPDKLAPGMTDGMSFGDPITKINALAKELKEGTLANGDKADVVIAMLDDDVEKNINNMDSAYVDGLMGGDTHVPYFFNQGENGYKISGTASGAYTDNLSKMIVKVDKNTGKVVKTSVEKIPAADIATCNSAESPVAGKIKAIVDDAKTKSEAEGKRVIAKNLQPNMKFARAIVGDKGPGSNRGHESTLGNLIADGLHTMLRDRQGNQVDIGMINAGDIRDDLETSDKGELTYAQTYAVQPFSNEVGYVTLTGKQFKEVIEEQWKTGLSEQNSRPLLKLSFSSNVSYLYDPHRPLGERVIHVAINGQPIDPQKKYTIGSLSFILSGGDSFPAITKGGPMVTNGDLDRDIFNKYLETHAKDIAVADEKHSIGMTVHTDDKETHIALRGLSYTEGPGLLTDKDTVSLRIGKYTVDNIVIDPTLSEPGLSGNDYNEPTAVARKAPITTDGAGAAQTVIDNAEMCKANEGKVENLPVELFVVRETGKHVYKVTRDAPGVTLECPKQIQPPDTRDSDTKDKVDVAKKKPGKVSSRLAHTGNDVSTLIVLFIVMCVAGTSIVLFAHYRKA